MLRLHRRLQRLHSRHAPLALFLVATVAVVALGVGIVPRVVGSKPAAPRVPAVISACDAACEAAADTAPTPDTPAIGTATASATPKVATAEAEPVPGSAQTRLLGCRAQRKSAARRAGRSVHVSRPMMRM